MERIPEPYRSVIAPVVSVLSLVGIVVSYLLNANDIAALGLQSDYFKAAAAAIFGLSLLAVLFDQRQEIQRLAIGNKNHGSSSALDAVPSEAMDFPPPSDHSLVSSEPLESPKNTEPVDERLVLLCNSYAIPAYEALQSVLRAVYDQCFSFGGWQGLSARYFRDYAIQPHYGDALHYVQDCIANGNNQELEAAFIRYCNIYLLAGSFAYQSSKLDTLADVTEIQLWVRRHEALIEQITILSGGVNREGLKIFLNLNHEYIELPRAVLQKASG